MGWLARNRVIPLEKLGFQNLMVNAASRWSNNQLLHVFQFLGGKINYEQAWLDLAAIQRQLGCKIV
jgi:hypothetical protein